MYKFSFFAFYPPPPDIFNNKLIEIMDINNRKYLINIHTDEENKLPQIDNIFLGEIVVNHNNKTPFIAFKSINENDEASFITTVTNVESSDDIEAPLIDKGKLKIPSRQKDLDKKEDKSNKITEITSGSTDEEYASAAAVYKYVQAQQIMHDSYVLSLDDSGVLSCKKNNIDNGFILNEVGTLSIG